MWYNDYWINEEGGIFTKIKLNGYLLDITNNKKTAIKTNGVKQKNKIFYEFNHEKYTLYISTFDKLILKRKTNEIECTFYFEQNKIKPAIYLVKENDLSLEINIRTDYIEKTDNYINIQYTVIDSNNSYEYNIEMSE